MLSLKNLFSSLVIATLICFQTFSTYAQIDTEFWFAVPNTCHDHGPGDDIQELRLASFNAVSVTVTVDIPSNPSFTPIITVLAPGGAQTVSFNNRADVEIPSLNTISKTGLRIKSTLPITAYYEIGRGTLNSEIFSLKGSNAFGRRFFTPSQTKYDIYKNYYSDYSKDPARNTINIVATENNTTVIIRLPPGKFAEGWGSLNERTIVLNLGETYSFAANSPFGADNLYGTLITSDKNIAVTICGDSLESPNGAIDLTGDQIVPVNIVGTDYLIPPGRNNVGSEVGNIAYVLATESGTNVFTNGNTQVSNNMNAGEMYALELPNQSAAVYLSANKPVYLLYLSGVDGEMGSPLLPTISCTGSKQVTFIRSTGQKFFLTLLAQNEAIGSFSITGGGAPQLAINNPANYISAPGFSGWKVFQQEIEAITPNVAITVNNSNGYFHLGIFNGQGGSARFGYFSDFGKLETQLPATLSACPNTLIKLDPKVFGTSSATWTYNGNPTSYPVVDGAISFLLPPQAVAGIADVYTVNIRDTRACEVTAQVKITVFPKPDVKLNVEGSRTVCSNDPNRFIEATMVTGTVVNPTGYKWTFAGTGLPGVLPSDPAQQRHFPTISGLYKVEVTDNNSCTDEAEVNITYNIAKIVDITNNRPLVCNNINFTLAIINNPIYNGFKDYEWRKQGSSEIIGTNTTFAPNTDGNYSLTVKDENNCVSSDNNTITFVSPVSFDLGDKSTVCSAENFNINVTLVPANASIKSLNWFKDGSATAFLSGITQKTFKPTTVGIYRVNIVDNNDCPFNDAINIAKFSNTVSVALNNPPTTVCSNADYALTHATPTVTPNFKSYVWRLNGSIVSAGAGSSFNSYKPTATGTYTLEVLDNNDCPSSDQKVVNWTIAQTFNLGPDQTAPICTNGNYLITVPNNFTIVDWRLNSNVFTPSSGILGRIHKPVVGQSGTIVVNAKDGNGCDANDDVAIGRVVNPASVSLSVPAGNFCSNEAKAISATPTNFPTYNWVFGGSPAPSATNVPSYLPRTSGEYTLNAVDLNGCNTSGKITVNYFDTLSFSLNTPPSVFCSNNTTYRITPSGGTFASFEFRRNGQVLNPISGPGISHRPTQSGRFLVTGTDANGCKSRREVSINFQDTANLSLPQLPAVICDNANGLNTTATIDVPGTYSNYVWRLNNTVFSPNISPSKHRPTAQGTYKITVTDGNGCTATASVFANYFVPAKITLSKSPNSNIACWNTNYTLTASNGFNSYDWTATTTPATSIPVNTKTYKPTRSGKYLVIGTDANTCKSKDSATITYVPDFKLNLGGSKAVCSTSGFAIDVSTIPNIVSYVWSNTASLPNPASNVSVFAVPNGAQYAGRYAVRLTDNNGCTDQDTLDYKVVTELPLELGNNRFACSYEGFAVDATSNYANYVWTNTAGLNNPSVTTSKFLVTRSGKYTVTVTDESGTCTATDTVTITYVPDLGFQLNNPFADTVCFNDVYPSRFILAKDSLTFTVGNYNWSWTVPSSSPQPDNVVKFQPNVSGRYIARVQDKSNLCFDSDTTDITFSALLSNFDLGNPFDTICFNKRDSITATRLEYRNAQYKWRWEVPTNTVNPTPKSIVYPDRTGKYLAELTDRYNCKAKDSVFVQFSDSLIDFDLGAADEKICISKVGDAKIIKATNSRYDNTLAYTWKWVVPTNQAKPGNVSQVIPKESGDYSVIITDRWGCTNSDAKNISYFDDLFSFKLTVPKTTICFNAPLADRTIVANDIKFNNLNTYKYTWTVPQNSQIKNLSDKSVVVDTSGKYKAIIENKITQCLSADSITVLYSDSLLDLAFNKPFDTICFNDPLQLQAIQATNRKYDNLTNYTWTWVTQTTPLGFPNPGNVAKVLPDRNGVYSAIVKDIHGCIDSASTIVSFDKSLQDLDLGDDSITVCFNIERLLTDSRYQLSEYQWTWDVPDMSKISNLKANKIAPDTTGWYTAIVKNKFLCSNTDSVRVQYSDSLRSFKLNKPADTICYNAINLDRKVYTNEVKYNNLAEYTWTWTVPAGATQPGNKFEAIPNKTGVYIANLKDRWGCPASDQTSVKYSDDLSGFDLGNPVDTICFNTPKFITATSEAFRDNAYTWQWLTFPTASIDPAGTKRFQAKTTGNYVVKVTNKELCVALDSVYVNFSDSLAGFSLGDLADTICATRILDSLRATDTRYNNLINYSWKWVFNNGQASIGNSYTIFPRQSGTYTARVTDVWKCAVDASKQVTYGDSIKIELGPDTIACSTADYVIRPGEGFAKYVWNIPNYFESTLRPQITDLYKVEVTDKLGCKSKDSVQVTYVPTINTELGRVKDICDTDDELTATIIAKAGFDTYQWMDNEPDTINTYRPTFPIFSGNSKTIDITLKVTKLICSATASTSVTFIKKDDGTLGADTIVCIGYEVFLDAGRNFTGYVWKAGLTGDSILSTNSNYTAKWPDIYTVNLVSRCGISAPSISVFNFDTIQAAFTSDAELCIGETLEITNTADKADDKKYKYLWFEKNTETLINVEKSSIVVEKEGNYQVMITDANDCFIRDSIMVVMTDDCFKIPNLFTPNNDGENQTFKIRGIYHGDWALEIYNRWGDRIYFNTKYDNSWEGEGVDTGVYYYELRHNVNGKKYKGWVQIAK